MRDLVMAGGILMCACAMAGAETLDLFRASRGGESAWARGDARVKREGMNLLFSESNAAGGYGDAHTVDRFPYFSDGVVEVDVSRVIAGQYVFQALGFNKGIHINTAEIIPSSAYTGSQTFRLGDFYLPGADEVMFKIWVELEEGAAVEIRELAYTVAIDEPLIAGDERFVDAAGWVSENLQLRPVAGRQAMVLGEDVNLGNMICSKRYLVEEVDKILFSMLAVQNGAVSLQLPVFDKSGTYIDSVDVMRDIGAGLHARNLGDVPWPTGAHSFEVKVWLSGAKAGAVADRLMLIKRKPGPAPAPAPTAEAATTNRPQS